jgi:hypothetical protein
MKKTIFIITISLWLTPLIQSCKKDAIKPHTQTIHVALKVNQTYLYDLGGFGIEEGAGIVTQASHFLISTANRDTSGNTPNIFYHYIPATNFVGTDEVTLKSETGSNGATANTNISYTTIKFTITN